MNNPITLSAGSTLSASFSSTSPVTYPPSISLSGIAQATNTLIAMGTVYLVAETQTSLLDASTSGVIVTRIDAVNNDSVPVTVAIYRGDALLIKMVIAPRATRELLNATSTASEALSLTSAIAAEVDARTAADAGLQDNLSAEVAARTAAGVTLQANIDAETDRAEAEEAAISSRTTANATAITDEESRAKAAENANTEAVSAEVDARSGADALLQTNIESETNRAATAEAALGERVTANTTAIADEAATRASADTTLQTNINTEAATRSSADTTLQNNITTEATRATAAEALKLARASNLADLADASVARSNLGLNFSPYVNILTDSGRFGSIASARSITLPSTSYTASTLSLTAASATITDGAGLIPTTTFAVGTLVTMTGWTNSANNLVQLRVASVSATTLVLEGDGAETLVDEPVGVSVKLTAHPMTNTSGLFLPTPNSIIRSAGKFIHNNTTNGGSGGGLAPVVRSFLPSVNRAGTSARFGVEFNFPEYVATGPDSSTYYQMTINDGSAWFGGVGNYLTKGFWAICTSGSVKIGGYYASINGGAYSLTTQAEIPLNVWRHYKAYHQEGIGYKNSCEEFVGTPGSKVVIVEAAAFPGLIPSSFTWAAPLINYYHII